MKFPRDLVVPEPTNALHEALGYDPTVEPMTLDPNATARWLIGAASDPILESPSGDWISHELGRKISSRPLHRVSAETYEIDQKKGLAALRHVDQGWLAGELAKIEASRSKTHMRAALVTKILGQLGLRVGGVGVRRSRMNGMEFGRRLHAKMIGLYQKQGRSYRDAHVMATGSMRSVCPVWVLESAKAGLPVSTIARSIVHGLAPHS